MLKRIIKECVICGKKIFIKPSHAEVEGTYCSLSCKSQGYKSRFIGENNPNFRHGRSHTEEWVKEHAKLWRKNNPDKIKYHNRLTKIKRKGIKGNHSKYDIEKLWEKQNGVCAVCGACLVKEGYHLDHIIPISRSGSNFIGNLQLLCVQCNLRKADMLPIKFKKKHGTMREDVEQMALIQWVEFNVKRYPELRWLFHIANGGFRHIATARRMKLLGVKKGIFDLCLPVARGGYHGLFIENKIKPNKLTKEQEDFRQHLIEENYKQAVCYSMEEAKYEVLNYLGLRGYNDERTIPVSGTLALSSSLTRRELEAQGARYYGIRSVEDKK